MQRKQAAFTLVEAIVSVAVFSIVLAMVYGVFFSLARSTVAGAEATVEIQRQRIALKTIEDSLSGLVKNENYSFLADTTIFDYPSISFVSRVPPDFLGNKEFGSQRLRRIEFTVEDDEDLGRSLVMYQEALMQPVNTQDIREPKRWVLGPNLDTFFFVFWSTINNEWVSEWTETNSVPSRLKFELAFKGADGEAARIEEIQKREIVVFSESITEAMLNPPPRGGRPNSGGRPPSRPRTPAGLDKYKRDRDRALKISKQINSQNNNLPSGSKSVKSYGKWANTARKYDLNSDGILDSGERARWRKDIANNSNRSNSASGGNRGGQTAGNSGSNGSNDSDDNNRGGGASTLPAALTLNEELETFGASSLQELVDLRVYDSMDHLQSTAPTGMQWAIDPITGKVIPVPL